ncbi:MAG: MarR family transcriptional regulator [Firmicutes bacterium]|nr:MarR family transcriptional regulator [Bacillota bacterium]
MPQSDASFEQTIIELDRLIRHANSIIRRRGRDILQEFDITPPQFDALLILKNNKGENLTIGELGERMYLACSTATDLVDRMERNGLVERIRDTNDRRVIRLQILEKGYQMVEEVLAARKRYLSEALKDVPQEDIQAMIKSMTQLDQLLRAKRG